MAENEGPLYERGTNGRYDVNHNGTNNHKPDEDTELDEEEHEHEYNSIIQTPNLAAYAEGIHEVVTLEFHDRGLSLDLSYAEAQELGRVIAEVVTYINGLKQS